VQLLLTGGRLNALGKSIIELAFDNEYRKTGSASKALRVAQFLVGSAPEVGSR